MTGDRRPLAEQSRAAPAAAPVGLASFDSGGRVLTATTQGYAVMGLLPEDFVAVSLLDLPGVPDPLVRAVADAITGRGTAFSVEVAGEWWHCHAVPAAEGSTAAGFLLGTAPSGSTDAPAATHVDDRLERVLASAAVCVAGFDSVGTITYASGSGYPALGVDPAATLGTSMFDQYGDSAFVVDSVARVLAGEDVDIVFEFRGRLWDVHYRTVPGEDGTIAGGLVMAQDVTDWVHDPGRLVPVHAPGRADPKVDLLTGLLSRQAVAELLTTHGEDEQAVVVLVDLDAFAVINEVYGHAAGDTVLVAVAERLRSIAGTAWSVGRWSDDVFALVRREPEAPRELAAMVARVTAVLAAPIDEGSVALHLTVSVGTASTETGPLSELLSAAALAVRAAKQGGRNQVQHYDPRMQSSAPRVPRLEAELRAAMADDQIGLHYQPLVRLSDRRPVGVEALARWSHPERGLLMPEHFIPLAERTGVIVPLGERLLREACHAAAAWQRTPPSDLSMQVAVNLSARQLTHPGVVAMVHDAISVAGCDPAGLTIEVTETAVMSDLEVAVATLSALKNLGLGIALDDFGTGYSSLVYLKRFPVDTLKIDGSFVAGLGYDPDDTAIVASLVSLAHSIGVTCVAEGVETAEQLTILETMGCDLVQGYVFGRALDQPGITNWLSRQPGPARVRRRAVVGATGEDPLAIERILELHRQGASLHTIAARINVEGRRTTKNQRWHHTSVARVIAEHSYPQRRQA